MRHARILGLRAVLFALAVFAVSASAQDAAGAFHISGTVINTASGMPIRQALVTVNLQPVFRPNSPTPQKTLTISVLTDAAGHFQVDRLEAGSYRCNAAKTGFTSARTAGEQLITIGTSKESLIVELSPLAKLSGRITDTDGEPVPGVSVRALQSQMEDGRRTARQVRSVTTDDQGKYRMWNFQPGDYYLVAAGRSGGTAVVVGPTPSSGLVHEGFDPTYYPAAKSRTSATVISLTPGQEFEADVKITLQPAFRVRGTLRNLIPYQPVTVELVRGEGEVSSNRVLVNASTGRFEANDVVPGTYLLRAKQTSGTNEIRGERPVQVGRDNVDGLVLDLVPGVTVSGVVLGLPSTDQAPATVARPRRGRYMNSQITLIPAEAEDDVAQRLQASPDEQGRFSIDNVSPGRYRLDVMGFGAYMASAVSGSKDLLTGDLIVEQGAAPPPIEIQLRNDAGSIDGSVDTPMPADSMWVLLARADGTNPEHTFAFQGRFRFEGIPPGDYELVLVKDINVLEFRNPAVVRALRGGEKVHVTARSTANVTLKGPAK